MIFHSTSHQIHLHGHDFALLQQSSTPLGGKTIFKFKLDNPPRRDVVMLPAGGFVVIAFKTDNPGTWLMHCHIAPHIAMGLGLQIMERREAALQIWPDDGSSVAINATKALCGLWSDWQSDCNNWWGGCKTAPSDFQDDSGV